MPEKEDTSAMGAADSNSDREQVLSNVIPIVRKCLLRLRDGDLFMDGLEKECYDRLRTSVTTKSDDGKEQLTEDFSKFLDIVADALMKEASGDETPENSKQQKKDRKRWLKFLKSHWELVEQEIQKYGNSNAAGSTTTSAVDEVTRSKENGGQPRAEDEFSSKPQTDDLGDSDANADSERVDEELDGDDTHGRLKKKSKKKKEKEKTKSKKKKKKKSKKLNNDEDESADAADGDEETNADAQVTDPKDFQDRIEKFERFRDETLSKIPEEIKKRFRQPGFSKWSKTWLPCLELSPFDVAPGEVRDQWLTMFENCMAQGRPPTRLVYWYGTENMDEAYSFLPPNKVVSYEEGVEKGLDKIPKPIANKQAKGKQLTKSEVQTLKALKQIKRDADLEPSERAEWLPEWEEFDMFIPTEEEMLDEEAEADIEVESPAQPAKKNKKRKKERDKGDEKKKKKRKTSEGKDHAEDKDEESAVQVERTVEDTIVAEEPKDFEYSTAEEKDDAFSDDIESDSEKDEDFVETVTSKRRKPKAKDGSASRKKKTDEQVEDGEKLARRRETDKKKREAKRKSEGGRNSGEPPAKKTSKKKGKSSKAEEQRRFEECEAVFLPTIQQLKTALNADDLEAAEQCVKCFRENVEITTPSFIRYHQFGMFVKESRKKFKSKGRDDLVNLCHDLTKDLKRVFNEKEPFVPEGFEPKIKKMVKKESISEKKSSKVEESDAAESSRPRQQQAVKLEDSQQKDLVIPKKEDDGIARKLSGPSIVEPAEQSQAPQIPKPARKAFSLKGMFERPKKAPTPKERIPDRAPVVSQPIVKKQIPSWLTGPITKGNAMPQDDERLLAIEFLQDAFALFPADKVNVGSSSLALESVIFDWSSCNGSRKGSERSEAYWEKIHDIVAALVGRNESGSLVQKILEGEFETPRDLLRITRKKLNAFFEGHAE